MILEFAVENYRSIKERQVISFSSVGKVRELKSNVIDTRKWGGILKTTILYGPNASGKSNILKAFSALRNLVSYSSDFKIDDKIPFYKPFRLNEESINKPTKFEIDFIAQDNIRYRYEVAYSAESIETESLIYYPNNQPSKLFIREKGKPFVFGTALKGDKKNIERQLTKNVLFLSKGANSKVEQLEIPYLFFKKFLYVSLDISSDSDDAIIRRYSDLIAKNKDPLIRCDNLSKLMRIGDIGIDRIDITEGPKVELPPEMPDKIKKSIQDQYKYKIRMIHKLVEKEKKGSETTFELEDESAGTIKLLAIGTLMFDALSDGSFLVIDELDRSLHPKLSRALILLFHNPKINLHNAQLLFASHDVSLLDNSLFRRDQVWFTEKESDGGTKLYSLSDFNGIRKETPYDKWYLTGRFGALPSIDELGILLEDKNENK